jgi:aspartyl/asparaginyl-tRNA synthetase
MEQILIYNELIQKLRTFFLKRGYVEVPTQSTLSILAACENPHSIVKYVFDGVEWPMIQTGQMVLEEVLLKNPDWPGVFCITTSYRDEKNPIPGRHNKIFPMFEFESKGGFEELKQLESELLTYLGFNAPLELTYEDICKKYDTDIVEAEHETKMWNNLGTSISLQKFPKRTSPFFNMNTEDGEIFEKIDVILYGQETIGSAVRSSDVKTMRKMFYEISDGEYAGKLFELFGKKRVESELEDFLSNNFFKRFGGGIGMTRLMRAYQLLKQ